MTKTITLTIIRKDLSPYHAPGFIEQEKQALESLKKIQYLGPEKNLHPLTPKISPCVWITNTHTLLPPLEVTIKQQVQLIIHPNSGYDNFDS